MKSITNTCCSAENLGIKLREKETMRTFMHKYSQINAHFCFASLYANVTSAKYFFKIVGLSCRRKPVPESTTTHCELSLTY